MKRGRFLFLAALVCFAVAWFVAINELIHGNYEAWVAGGLAFLAAALAAERFA